MDTGSFIRMQWFVQNYLQGDEKCRVLDIGSYDVNGTHKPIFDNPRFEYVGLDVEAGPNVDIVPANPYIWKEVDSNSFDVVISGQTFEHAEFFWLTMGEMTRVLRPGGFICITAPRKIELHRFPVDCYRFAADGMLALARYCNLEPLHASTNRAPSQDLEEWYSTTLQQSMLVARKPENWNGMLDVENYKLHPADLEKFATGMVRSKMPKVTFFQIFKIAKREILRRIGITKERWNRE